MRPGVRFFALVVAEQTAPPLVVLVAVGLAVIGLTAGSLWLLVRTLPRLKGLPSRVIGLAIAYNALIAGVKFVLAPLGFYQTNRRVDFESFFGLGGLLAAGAVGTFLLYFLALRVIYWYHRPWVRADLETDSERKPKRKKWVIVAAMAGMIVLTGGGFLILIYLAAVDSLQYLWFIFSSVASGLIVVMLIGATILAGATFKEAGEQAVAVGNATLLASLFWVATCLLVAYHALWVVFILILNSVWPLRVVVPK